MTHSPAGYLIAWRLVQRLHFLRDPVWNAKQRITGNEQNVHVGGVVTR